MEQNLNIAEILKDKSKGTKLYSSAFGKMTYNGVTYDADGTKIWLLTENKVNTLYLSDGKYREGGEVTLYPSKEMRNWRKFLWKKGDVLVNEDGSVHIIFEKFEDDAYTMFSGKYYYSKDGKKAYSYCGECDNVITKEFTLETEDAAKTYISFIEKRLDGKLNRETLEVEKTQPEFKDGDIVAVDLDRKNIRIFKEKKNENNICFGKYYIGFSFNNEGKLIQTFKNYTADCSSDRLATEEEKQQLFDALAKEGKAWDAEKKMLVDLKPKVRFKSFDKIVAFEEINKEWVCDMFSHYAKNDGRDIIIGIGGLAYLKALPFNEETAKLIGTTDDWEG